MMYLHYVAAISRGVQGMALLRAELQLFQSSVRKMQREKLHTENKQVNKQVRTLRCVAPWCLPKEEPN